MKKIIALALALCMTVSMVCMAGATSFTDDAQIDIQNQEAVTVLSEMGIIGGMGDGTFAPNNTLTRAQAAKIICCMVLGVKQADALPASGAKFSDVPASHWSAKFVNYCAEKGIVSGVGSGKFGPNNKLTGFAFAKMLLVAALNFNAESEGLVGATWEKNVNKLLVENRLNLGLVINSKDLTRQNACRLALNCMFFGEDTNPESTLAYKTFGVARIAGKADKTNYGRPTKIYTSEEDSICWEGTDLTVAASPFFSVKSGILTGGKIYTACGNVEVPTENIMCTRNGVNFAPANFPNTITQGNSKTFDCTDNGVALEIYYDASTTLYTIIELANFCAKVSDVVEPVTMSDGTVLEHGTVTLDNGLSAQSDEFTTADVGTFSLYKGMGKTTWKTPVAIGEVNKPKIVTGTLSAVDEDATVTVAGKTYTVSKRFAYNTGKSYIAEGGALGDTVNVVLDDNGVAYAIYQ